MKKAFNICLLIILFLGDIYLNEKNYYFLLIYICLFLYHLYVFYLLFHNQKVLHLDLDLKNFIFTSLILYLFSYFIIYDPNPFFCIITFYHIL